MPEKLKSTYEPIVPNENYPITPFLRVSKVMIVDPQWKHLTILAIVAYFLMFERALASRTNPRFHDRDGYPFIFFSQEELAGLLRVSLPKCRKVLAELEGAELIRRVHSYLTLPDMIYVRYFGSPIYEVDHSEETKLE